MNFLSLVGSGLSVPKSGFTFFEKRPLVIGKSDTPDKIKKIREGKLKPGKIDTKL